MANDPALEGYFDSPYSLEEVSRLARSLDPFERWEAANALSFVNKDLAEELRKLLIVDEDELVRSTIISRSKPTKNSMSLAPTWRSTQNLDLSGGEFLRDGEIKNSGHLYLDQWGHQNEWLDADKEGKLFHAVRNGSSSERQAAIEELVASHYGLVKKIAISLEDSGGELEDRIQEGLISVISSIEAFDEKRGHRFSAYLIRTIRTSTVRAIDDTMRLIRVPTHGVEKYSKYKKIFREVYGDDIPLSAKESLSREVDTTPQTMKMVISALAEIPSIQSKAHRKCFEQIPDERETFEGVENAQMLEILDCTLSDLTPREEGIIRMRYGIGHETPQTLDEIGETYCVTRERVRQIETIAMRKLREPGNSAVLRPFVGLDEPKWTYFNELGSPTEISPDFIYPHMAGSFSDQYTTVMFEVGSVGYKNGHTYINSHEQENFYIFIQRSLISLDREAIAALLVNRLIKISGVLRNRNNGRFSIELKDAKQIAFVPAERSSQQQLNSLFEGKTPEPGAKTYRKAISSKDDLDSQPERSAVRRSIGEYFRFGRATS